ncbi:MAG: hypothetical protein COV44_11845 [Deltaproteobacteria bacterium CG11_big_fil_rev_8_21_14_0_20_45_16]|nr:MAG: hypothetical protein COV44_11845 [Deltaproteobacteria bacterium CG11_big_fil_rev_8_21_14_0_20_45_16]
MLLASFIKVDAAPPHEFKWSLGYKSFDRGEEVAHETFRLSNMEEELPFSHPIVKSCKISEVSANSDEGLASESRFIHCEVLNEYGESVSISNIAICFESSSEDAALLFRSGEDLELGFYLYLECSSSRSEKAAGDEY